MRAGFGRSECVVQRWSIFAFKVIAFPGPLNADRAGPWARAAHEDEA